ncbi:hypothetical protein V1477_020798 [Vespula maculifrons]|uniref:Uncharacterized protein n=1 Tax=Vespula maculifrons TaxID=7453 RepID=A0ABD2AMX7_VESMC
MEHLDIVCDGTVVDTSMFLVLLCPQTPQTQPFAQLISSNCNLVDERGNKDSSRISKRLDVYARHPSLCLDDKYSEEYKEVDKMIVLEVTRANVLPPVCKHFSVDPDL